MKRYIVSLGMYLYPVFASSMEEAKERAVDWHILSSEKSSSGLSKEELLKIARIKR